MDLLAAITRGLRAGLGADPRPRPQARRAAEPKREPRQKRAPRQKPAELALAPVSPDATPAPIPEVAPLRRHARPCGCGARGPHRAACTGEPAPSMPPTEAEIASMLRRQGQKGDAGDPPKPPLRRRARGEPLWTELAADDPRWDLHCRPLLAFLEEPRPQRLVYVWVRQQGRPVGEAEAMLSWLESRGRIVRDRENRWVKAPFTVERSAVIVNEHGFVTEVPCAPEATP